MIRTLLFNLYYTVTSIFLMQSRDDKYMGGKVALKSPTCFTNS